MLYGTRVFDQTVNEYVYIPWTVSLRMMERRCGCHKWEVQDVNLETVSVETCAIAVYGKVLDARAPQESAERAA